MEIGVGVKHVCWCQTHLLPPNMVCVPVALDEPVVPALASCVACAAR